MFHGPPRLLNSYCGVECVVNGQEVFAELMGVCKSFLHWSLSSFTADGRPAAASRARAECSGWAWKCCVLYVSGEIYIIKVTALTIFKYTIQGH